MEEGEELQALRGRWTICAMLFVATSINYMDRQVLSILKPALSGSVIHLQPLLPGWPTVETSIHLTDVQYGNILAAFQIAYALGVVFAGRLVDRLGCRKGYPIVTGLWSLAAMGHALVNSVLGFGIARFLLGLGESGNFPAAVKATAEWFPPKERALATGIFNSGASVGAILAPLTVPWVALHFGWRAAFLITGLFSAIWIVWWSIRYRTPERAAAMCEVVTAKPSTLAWWKLLRYRQAWGFMLGKFLTDPVWWFFLFWLPQYFQFALQSGPVSYWPAAGGGLRVVHRGQRRRGMAAQEVSQLWNAVEVCTAGSDADLCVPCGSYRGCRWPEVRVVCRGVAEPGSGGASGLVSQYLHYGIGYVSGRACRHRGQLWPGGRRAGRSNLSAHCRTHIAIHPQFCATVYVFGFGLPYRVADPENPGARIEEGRAGEQLSVQSPRVSAIF